MCVMNSFKIIFFPTKNMFLNSEVNLSLQVGSLASIELLLPCIHQILDLF